MIGRKAGALLLLLFAACIEDPIQPKGPGSAEPGAGPGGLVELTITGIGTAHLSSSVRSIPGEVLPGTPLQAPVGVAAAASSPAFARLQSAGTTGGIQLELLSPGEFTQGTPGVDGWHYVTATYRVRNADFGGNAYGTDRHNLTFVAVSGSGAHATVGGTAVRDMRRFDNSPADPALALATYPTGAAVDGGGGTITTSGADFFQAFSEAIALEVNKAPAAVSVLPYGFVVRNPNHPSDRTLPASPAVGQFDGLVTFAFKIPLQASPTNDAYSLTMLFQTVDDLVPVVTQSVEDSSAAARAAVQARATALGATVLSLDGSTFPPLTTEQLCVVRLNGTNAAATSFLVNNRSITNFTPAPYSGGSSFVAPGGLFSFNTCQRFAAATSATFAVNGSQSGRLTGTYPAGGTTIATAIPSPGYFPGENLQVSLTPGLVSGYGSALASPRVHQYRVATSAGDGNFSTPATYGVGDEPNGIAAADFNHDGLLDLAVANKSGASVSVLLGTGGGGFAAAVPYTPSGIAEALDVAAGDVDRDGDIDLVVPIHDKIRIMLNDGAGVFSPGDLLNRRNSNYSRVALADFNADGKLDIVASNETDALTVFLGTGTGGFALSSQPAGESAPPHSGNIAVADFNEDGKLDFIVATTNFVLWIHLGDGAGGFLDISAPLTGGQAWVATGDVNGDGHADVVYSANTVNQGLGVVFGDGNGGFSEPAGPASTVNGSSSVALGDMDADGDLDVISANGIGGGNNSVLAFMRNNGAGVFALHPATTTPTQGNHSDVLALGDFDNNGALDIATANFGGDDVSVLKSIAISATNDTYAPVLVGNVSVNTASGPTPFSVTTNDLIGGSETLTLVGGGPIVGGQQSYTTPEGSVVTLTVSGASRGKFAFEPALGLGNTTQTFQYQIVGATTTPAATVTLTIGSQVIWFVDASAPTCLTPGAGCGRLSHPFSTLAALQAVNTNLPGQVENGDAIFLYENASSYTGPVTLLNGQKLIGQDAAASLASILGVSPPSSSPALPAMNTGGPVTTIVGGANAVTLASGASATIRGVTLGSTSGGASLSASSFGTLTVRDASINNPVGGAIFLNTGTLDAQFASVTSGGGSNGIFLSVVLAGTSSFGTGSLSGASGAAFAVSGNSTGDFSYAGNIAGTLTGNAISIGNGTSSITFSGNITQSNSRNGITINARSGGTILFSGSQTLSTGTFPAVSLTSNSGSTVSFTGGALLITTSTGSGLTATGGGTVTVTGANNTITTTTGTPLTVNGVTIGAAGLTFKSISANGAANGIYLSSTGSSGGLTVTGDGSLAKNGSGGTLRRTLGSDGFTNGAAIYLSNTRDVSLASMNLRGSDNYGLSAATVTNLALRGMVIDSTHGNNSSLDEDALWLSGVTGVVTVHNSTITGGANDGLHLANSSGDLNRLTITGSTIGTGASGANDAVTIEALSGAIVRVTVTGTTLTDAPGDLFQFGSSNSAITDLIFTGNTVTNGHASILSGGGGFTLAYDFGGDVANTSNTFDVENNTFSGARGVGVNVFKSTGHGSVAGKLLNNNIGTGSANGSLEAAGMQLRQSGSGTFTVRASNNAIKKYGDVGLLASAAEATSGYGTPAVNLTLQGNTLTAPLAGSTGGLYMTFGATATDNQGVCLAVGGGAGSLKNVLTGSDASLVSDLTLVKNATTAVGIAGYAGGSVGAYLAGLNTVTLGPTASGTFSPAGSCPTPP